mmetsp:Transcript_17332/g.20002  ORF Transcript_17332/g.20002 Transcript_17332/m.20002 type:complete len:149 (+) Transcript_17332:258-704(+)|eukprot:CAMPEP_0194147168 /NCGR_PEP_ID=MMETSP0152-20130528/22561_1 /TAXON_ID=1049557 /ORGANISM="Thalassiothrix antarctica, Strain L6-D1" /LENGTH=148 /DNA_ID=CAMNT_0038847869 /DNA_START=187 /DNA_END=633 /DNA_ORIENTATION=+
MKQFLVNLLFYTLVYLSESYQQCYSTVGKSNSCYNRGVVLYSTEEEARLDAFDDKDDYVSDSSKQMRPIDRLRRVSELIKEKALGAEGEHLIKVQAELDEVGGKNMHPQFRGLKRMKKGKKKVQKDQKVKQKVPKGSKNELLDDMIYW